MVSFWAVFTVHNKFTNISKATTFAPRFKAPLVSSHFCGNVALKESQPLVEKKMNDRGFLIPQDVRTLYFSIFFLV